MDKEKSKDGFNLRFLAIVSTIVAILGLFLFIISFIDNRIERYVNNPQFIKGIARETRLPFMIFDEKEVVHFDGEAFIHIDTLRINRNKKHELVSIDIFPKEFLNTPPILECWGIQIQFYDPVRIAPNGWRFSAPEDGADVFLTSGRVLATKYKITLILDN